MEDVKEWAVAMRESEEELVEKITECAGKLAEDLMPRARAKAVEENFKTEIVMTIKLDMASLKPTFKMEGFVPPTVLQCREY